MLRVHALHRQGHGGGERVGGGLRGVVYGVVRNHETHRFNRKIQFKIYGTAVVHVKDKILGAVIGSNK